MDTQDDFEPQIDALLASGRHYVAWARMRERVETHPTLALFHTVARYADRLEEEAADLRRARIALLGSFTLSPLVPVLKARALSARVKADIYVGGFNAWTQEVLSDDSGLRRFRPDVIYLALRAEDVAPSLVHRFVPLKESEIKTQMATAAGALEDFLSSLRRWSRAKVVVHSLVCPAFPAFGIRDCQFPGGQGLAFREFNDLWAEVVKWTGDAWVLDLEGVIREVGWNHWYDPRLWAVARLPLSAGAMARLAEEYVKYLQAFLGLTRKVLVLDLDDTLWGGIIGEDGFHGIQLGPDYPGSAFVDLQQAILNLHDRGVVLAINSKNNEAEALEVLEKHPWMVLRPEHFAAMRINWNDKAENLEEVADELNLGLDSFVYVDDSATECERIRQTHPEVLTVHLSESPERRPDRLRRLGAFDTLSFSPEDQKRSQMYRAEGARKQLKSQAGSLEDFYASLEMELTVRRIDDVSIPRAAQLTQRTNQFNLTTRRYSESEIAALVQSGECEVYTAQLRDRFGDDGIVGLAILRRNGDSLFIDTFLMSCRVIARGVETAFLTFLLRQANHLGVRKIVGEYRPTKNNKLTSDFYAKHGFIEVPHSQKGKWQIDSLEFGRTYPHWFRIHSDIDES